MDADGELRKTIPHIPELWENANTPMSSHMFGYVKDANLDIRDGTHPILTNMVSANGQKHQNDPAPLGPVTILVVADVKPPANLQQVCKEPLPMAN